jgi:hypothetical protein
VKEEDIHIFQMVDEHVGEIALKLGNEKGRRIPKVPRKDRT